MRPVLLATAAAAIAMGSAIATAKAETTYPYCAYSSARGDTFSNCGFVSMEQCYQTVRGQGGWCQVNPYWTATPPANGKGRRASARQLSGS